MNNVRLSRCILQSCAVVRKEIHSNLYNSNQPHVPFLTLTMTFSSFAEGKRASERGIFLLDVPENPEASVYIQNHQNGSSVSSRREKLLKFGSS